MRETGRIPAENAQKRIIECGGWLIKQSAKLVPLLCDEHCEVCVRLVAKDGVPSMEVTVDNRHVNDFEETR